uniref:Uncharacterized protein n=1 Tax=Arundo donax TaxID=35708 RepID=A0A0A9EFM3_ARUDO
MSAADRLLPCAASNSLLVACPTSSCRSPATHAASSRRDLTAPPLAAATKPFPNPSHACVNWNTGSLV